MNLQTGITNPFVLGELVVGAYIDWNALDNPAEKLAEVLTIPKEDIFDIQKPILSPTVSIDAAGNVFPLEPSNSKFQNTSSRGIKEPLIQECQAAR